MVKVRWVKKPRSGSGGHGTGKDVDMVDGTHAEEFILTDPDKNPNLKKILNIYWDQDTEELVIVTETEETP